MLSKSRRKSTGKKGLPLQYEAAPPIKNKKLLELLSGPDLEGGTGGTHTLSNGKPLLKRGPAQR
jgi:hypothetical protein